MLEESHLKSAEPINKGANLLTILRNNGDFQLLTKVKEDERAKWKEIFYPFEQLADEVKVLCLCRPFVLKSSFLLMSFVATRLRLIPFSF